MRSSRGPPAHPGELDIAIAMTHDRCLIPDKDLRVEQGANVTLGYRSRTPTPTTARHGTVFDVAGRGVSDPTSLNAAISAAWRMVGADR